MDIYDVQDYWDPGEAPTADEGYPTYRFKGLTGHEHEIFPLQDPEVVDYVSDIYEANVACQTARHAREVGEFLPPEDVLRIAAKDGWGARVCAVVDGYKVLRVKATDMAELVAEAVLIMKPAWSLIGIGLGRHELCLYLARECDEAEARELKQKVKDKVEKHNHKSKDKRHHGGRTSHGGGGRSRSGGQPNEGGRSGSKGQSEGRHSEGRHERPTEGGQHRSGGQCAAMGHSGGRRRGKGFSAPRASQTKPASIAETIRTVNAGHWQRSKGPWAFGGVAGASGSTGGEDRGARGRHGARGHPPAHGEYGARRGAPAGGGYGGGGGPHGRRMW